MTKALQQMTVAEMDRQRIWMQHLDVMQVEVSAAHRHWQFMHEKVSTQYRFVSFNFFV